MKFFTQRSWATFGALALSFGIALGGCTSAGKNFTPSVAKLPRNVCPTQASKSGITIQTLCNGGGGAIPLIHDITYVDNVPDTQQLEFNTSYGIYNVHVIQPTVGSLVQVDFVNTQTGETRTTTFAPQDTTTRHPQASASCGLWCSYVVGHVIDYLINWALNPCNGDCGQMTYGQPNYAPPPGSQWYPTPILIPTNGSLPPGWVPATPNNGLPYTTTTPPSCPQGWIAKNCTGNPANTYL